MDIQLVDKEYNKETFEMEFTYAFKFKLNERLENISIPKEDLIQIMCELFKKKLSERLNNNCDREA
jgi:hypothetical protein